MWQKAKRDSQDDGLAPFDLRTPLIRMSEEDVWTIGDACEGVQIFGATGSGKTSGSGAALARAFLRAGFGGMVLCAKPEERQLWEQYAYETERSDHVIIVSPQEAARFNFMDYELRRSGNGAGQTENLVNLFSRIIEIAEGRRESGGDPFWQRATQELIRNAVDLLSLSKGTISLDDLQRVITDAPKSQMEVGDAEWQERSFCAECIQEADELLNREGADPDKKHDFETVARYWLSSFAKLNDRTRTSIVATFTSMVDILLHGAAWKLLCTTTTIVPEMTYRDGAIIILDLSIQEYQEVGRIVQGIFKYVFQRAVVRRNSEAQMRPVFLWADEAQNFVSSYDYQYQAVARSARACTVYLTQNISNYYSVLGRYGRDETHAMLGNFQTKIFHANTDYATNHYASEMIAQDWTTTYNYGRNSSAQGEGQNSGGSQVMQYKVLPAAFTMLRKGGPANGGQVDGIIVQGGHLWKATGEIFMRVTFTQK